MALVFSISVPVYGMELFLPTALESVRVQKASTLVSFLDASPGGKSQDAAKKYDSLITYRYHRKDDGQSASIQEGWDNTGGDIVAWLNADDYYFPWTLSAVEEAFGRYPDADVIFGHGVNVTPEGDFEMYFPAIDENPSTLLKRCTIVQPACFVRRAAMEKIGGLDKSLVYTMDWDFWIRLYKAGAKFQFLDTPLAAVRIYAGTKTLAGAKQRYEELYSILKANAGVARAFVSLIGCRFYDLQYASRGPLGRALFAIGLAPRRVFRRFRDNGRLINGLEVWSHRVPSGACKIIVPWFLRESPKTIGVVVDKPGAYRLRAGPLDAPFLFQSSRSITVESEEMMGVAYEVKLNSPLTGSGILEAEVSSELKNWRLLKFYTQ
jgi:hypothetical protein